jgi:hypothetical protein
LFLAEKIELLTAAGLSLHPPKYFSPGEIRRLMRKDLIFATNGGEFHTVRHRVPLETLQAALRGDVQRDRLPRALDNSTTRQTPGGEHSHRWGAGEAHPYSQQSGYGTGWDEPPAAT